MRKNKYLKFICLSVLTILTAVSADTSSFSALSLGDIEPTLNNTTGTAYADSLVLKNHNYASWAYLSNTSFSLSASYYLHNTENSAGVKSEYDRFSFEDISFALPFGDRHFFGLSYYPVSIVDITNVSDTETLVPESFENTYVSTLETRKGSISNFSLIYGKGFDTFAADIKGSFKLGNYDISRRYKYITYVWNPVSSAWDTEWEKYFEAKDKTQILHFTLGGGLFYKTPFGVNVGSDFSFPVYSYANRISEFDRTTSYGTVIEELSDTENEINDPEWPLEYSLGLSYKVSKFIISYDMSYKNFSGLNIGIDDTKLVDYTRNTIGISFDPRNRKYDPYYLRMVYTGALSVEKRPYEYGGKSIYDISETLGFNLPFNDDNTNIEIKFSLTQSGSTDNNGLEDNIFRIQFNLISSDRWRLKKEKYND
ncbi:MAG TPA: hypothetical protein PLK90_10045 [Clostridiales bacterium]|nr:hypothetical protein [Clostridiales bacterium]HQP70728.1 hypothetical protein [Clostridiales bacterium]